MGKLNFITFNVDTKYIDRILSSISFSNKQYTGIKPILALLLGAHSIYTANKRLASEYIYSARMLLKNDLKPALTYYLTKFDYVMSHPRKMLLEKELLQPALKLHGFDDVFDYIVRAESNFGEEKLEESISLMRTAYEKLIFRIRELLEGTKSEKFGIDHKALFEFKFLDQGLYEYNGKLYSLLSAYGSHGKCKPTPLIANFIIGSAVESIHFLVSMINRKLE